MNFRRLVRSLFVLLVPELNLSINYINPYPSSLLHHVDTVSTYLTRPSRKVLDVFLSCFIWTTVELNAPYKRLPYCLIVAPVALCLYIVLFPIGLLGWLMWAPIVNKRTPYKISVHSAIARHPEVQEKYSVGTTNLCIMPEFISRINNLCNTWQRAVDCGSRIATQQMKYCYSNSGNRYNVFDQQSSSERRAEIDQNKHINKNGEAASQPKQTKYNIEHVNHDILEEFPPLDFLLVQEAWDIIWSREFGQELHRVYPYIVQDAAVYSFASNCFLSNSGLLIASKFPFIDVSFNWFRTRCSQDRYACKGLLQVKVELGRDRQGRLVVGYLNNTHLQAFKGTTTVHYGQLAEIDRHVEEFRAKTLKPGEVVAFDVFGGDFNLDNVSPVDKPESRHPIFTKYVDVGRVQPGQDHKWVVGTEMRQMPLHDVQISTPSGLKKALEDPYKMQHYILDANMKSHCYEAVMAMPEKGPDGKVILSPVGGKRRIDFAMFKEGDGVVPVALNPISQMAGLTDHIPYCLTFKVTNR